MRTLLHLTIALLLSHGQVSAQSLNSTGAAPFPGHRYLSRYQFAEPSDSTDFLQFIRSLRADGGPTQANGTPKRYRPVWLVSEHGGFAVVSGGDGQVITLEAERPALDAFDTMTLHMRTADGRACVVRLWERPCAMICRTTTYYLEE